MDGLFKTFTSFVMLLGFFFLLFFLPMQFNPIGFVLLERRLFHRLSFCCCCRRIRRSALADAFAAIEFVAAKAAEAAELRLFVPL